jgi:hypothetical protein
MKRLILAGLVLAGAFGSVLIPTPAANAQGGPCAGVRCLECPVGYELKPTGGNCCRCVPIN